VLQGEDIDFNFLGSKEKKMLERLAEHSGHTMVEHLKWLIRRRALGHLKDLGDDRGNFRLYEKDLSTLAVDEVELRE
jgi:hypothetical protein